VAGIAKAVDAWAAAWQKVRALRSCRARLVADLEALACGARTVLMLDYVPGLQAKALLWAVQRFCAFWPCAAMTLHGCPYLVHLPALVAQCKALCSAHAAADATPTDNCAMVPVLIGFRPQEGSQEQSRVGPVMLQHSESQAVFSQLQGLLTALEQHQAKASTKVLDLEAVRGLPLMPTLSGLLLGYPVVYVLESVEGAAAAARALSAQPLTLITAHATLPEELAAGCDKDAGQQHAAAVGMGADVMSACSVPSHMWEEGVEGEDGAVQTAAGSGSLHRAVQAWAAHWEAALSGSGLKWQGWHAQSLGIRSVNF